MCFFCVFLYRVFRAIIDPNIIYYLKRVSNGLRKKKKTLRTPLSCVRLRVYWLFFNTRYTRWWALTRACAFTFDFHWWTAAEKVFFFHGENTATTTSSLVLLLVLLFIIFFPRWPRYEYARNATFLSLSFSSSRPVKAFFFFFTRRQDTTAARWCVPRDTLRSSLCTRAGLVKIKYRVNFVEKAFCFPEYVIRRGRLDCASPVFALWKSQEKLVWKNKNYYLFSYEI